MTGHKDHNRISADDVPIVFDDACIKRLAGISKLRPSVDLVLFGKGVREAARIYARSSWVPNDNELHVEISALHKAAERKIFETLAKLLSELSPRARELLNDRGNRPSFRFQLPNPEVMRDAEHRQEACVRIASLCRIGGQRVEGRRRPKRPNRSRTWRWEFHAPQSNAGFQRRQAEREFVMWLRVAWVEAIGKNPAETADPRKPGPFARLVRECLNLVGAKDANAINLINQLDCQRKLVKTQTATLNSPPVR
jgi:hypothetical protein